MLQKIALAILISSSALAFTPITRQQANQLATDYYKTQFLKSKNFALVDQCPIEDRTSCIQVICDKSSACQFDSEVKKIAEACRGVSGDCLSAVCEKSGSCAFESSALELAVSCKSSNGLCTKVGCEKTGACVFESSAKEIAQACVGVIDGNCVATACDRSSACTFESSFTEIAKACSGR